MFKLQHSTEVKYICDSTRAFHSTGRMEIDLLNIFNHYKQIDYLIVAILL